MSELRKNLLLNNDPAFASTSGRESNKSPSPNTRMKSVIHIRPLSAAISLLLSPLAIAQDSEVESPESEAIVSDREKVELVDDSNVSEAIERRPDLQFNNITIDGESSNGSLSDLPSEAVDSLEVLRAITPDLDADARGGSLNVESKPIFLLENSVNKMEASSTYDEEGGVWATDLSFTTSRSVGDFGYRISLAREDSNSYNEGISSDWLIEPISGLYAPETVVFDSKVSKGNETSFNTRIDYSISESLYMFARFDWEEEAEEETRPKVIYRFDSGDYQSVSTNSGTSDGATVEKELLHFHSESSKHFWQLGIVKTGDIFQMDAKVSINQNTYFEPDWFVVEFEDDNAQLDYTWSNPSFIQVNGVSENATDYAFVDLLDERWRNAQDDLIATLNLKRSFESEKLKGFLKGGVKFRAREKEQTSDSHLFSEYLDDFDLSDVSEDGGTTQELAIAYPFGPIPNASQSRSFFAENNQNFPLNIRRTRENSDGNSYSVQEDVSSAYLMLSTEWGPFRSIVGGRVEETAISYQANEVRIGESGDYLETIPRSGDHSYSNFFPSLHLRYFLNEKTTLIGAWTKSIKRPDYGSVVPFRQINYGNRSIEEGNPDLEPTLFDNLDVSMDYEMTANSTLSLELFSREISDLVFWENTILSGGPFDGFERGQNRNGPSASRSGMNLIWNQSMSEWAKPLEGVSLNVKASIIDSESEYPNRPLDTLPAVYDSDFSIQVSATYDKGKTFAQLVYQEKDDYLTSVNDQPWRDRYEPGREILDFTASYKIQDNTRIFLEAENLLSAPRERYIGDITRPTRYSVALQEYTAGVKMNF